MDGRVGHEKTRGVKTLHNIYLFNDNIIIILYRKL